VTPPRMKIKMALLVESIGLIPGSLNTAVRLCSLLTVNDSVWRSRFKMQQLTPKLLLFPLL